MTTQQRYRGCLLGLAVGDAVGTTLEFKRPGSFRPITDMIGGGPFHLAPGQWTDDTSMALCLAESLFFNRDSMQQISWNGMWDGVAKDTSAAQVDASISERRPANRSIVSCALRSHFADPPSRIRQVTDPLCGLLRCPCYSLMIQPARSKWRRIVRERHMVPLRRWMPAATLPA